jgi:hypothetical protein
MLQFYFLSVLLNVASGLILVYGLDFNKPNTEKDETGGADTPANSSFMGSNTFFDDSTFRLVLGIMTGFVGVMKLLSVVQNDMPVVGDLLPALAGMAGSFCLLLEYYRVRTGTSRTLPQIFERIFVGGRKYIGIFCIIAGLLHFIFPKVLFL